MATLSGDEEAAAALEASARAVFMARGPVLDLGTAAPVSGSYRGVDAMGLFESLATGQPGQFFAARA